MRSIIRFTCLFFLIIYSSVSYSQVLQAGVSKSMKLGIIIETKEPEKAWNAFRFANAVKEQGHEVKIFLMGEAVECEKIVDEKYDVNDQLKSFVKAGGQILACGTCLNSRNMEGTAACPISTMMDCVKMVEWADKVITF